MYSTFMPITKLMFAKHEININTVENIVHQTTMSTKNIEVTKRTYSQHHYNAYFKIDQ